MYFVKYYTVAHKYEMFVIILIFFNSIAFRFGHHLTVKKIQFQPLLSETDIRYREGILQMASCGADTIVRVYDIFLKQIS